MRTLLADDNKGGDDSKNKTKHEGANTPNVFIHFCIMDGKGFPCYKGLLKTS